MRAFPHSVIAGAFAYGSGYDYPEIAVVAVVSGAMELLPQRRLRFLTHHVGLWAVLFMAAIWMMRPEGSPLRHLPVAIWSVPLGALLHLAVDFLSTAEEVYVLGRRPLHLDLVRTGTPLEWPLVTAGACLCVFGMDAPNWVMWEVVRHGPMFTIILVCGVLGWSWDQSKRWRTKAAPVAIRATEINRAWRGDADSASPVDAQIGASEPEQDGISKRQLPRPEGRSLEESTEATQAHERLSAVGIPGLQAGEDVNDQVTDQVEPSSSTLATDQSARQATTQTRSGFGAHSRIRQWLARLLLGRSGEESQPEHECPTDQSALSSNTDTTDQATDQVEPASSTDAADQREPQATSAFGAHSRIHQLLAQLPLGGSGEEAPSERECPTEQPAPSSSTDTTDPATDQATDQVEPASSTDAADQDTDPELGRPQPSGRGGCQQVEPSSSTLATGGERSVVPSWESAAMATFYREIVEPLWNDSSGTVVEREYAQPLLDVMSLLDAHRDAPSVNRSPNKGPGDPLYEALSRVPLLEHSIHVAYAARKIAIARMTADNFRAYEGGYLLACLAHDVGKLSDLRPDPNRYASDSHPIYSQRYLQSLGERMGPFSGNLAKRWSTILDAVRYHHESSCPAGGNLYHEILREADFKAREMEAVATAGVTPPSSPDQGKPRSHPPSTVSTTRVMDWPIGMSLEHILARLAHYVNFVHPLVTAHWKSCSQRDGYVYYTLDIFDEAIREAVAASTDAACPKRYVWLNEDDGASRSARHMFIYQALREKGWAHPAIRQPYYSNTFVVVNTDTKRTWTLRLVPVACDGLGRTMDELERERVDIPLLRALSVRNGNWRKDTKS